MIKVQNLARKYEDQGFMVTSHDQKKEIQKVFSIHVHVRKLLFTMEKEKLLYRSAFYKHVSFTNPWMCSF